MAKDQDIQVQQTVQASAVAPSAPNAPNAIDDRIRVKNRWDRMTAGIRPGEVGLVSRARVIKTGAYKAGYLTEDLTAPPIKEAFSSPTGGMQLPPLQQTLEFIREAATVEELMDLVQHDTRDAVKKAGAARYDALTKSDRA